VSGLSYPELAEALGRPVGTVKSDVHRGVRLLRRALETEDERSHGVAP
jgi:DNA-directed RNA polymerase specialized sigma24 family protein